jgi:hypothetical protein
MEDDLGEHSHKKIFSHKKKFLFSMEAKVRSWLVYPENASFPCISDLPRLHREHKKEYT